ncbi:putative transcription factor C3H family [Rosa chinensis]|uniref:Putative transcription factor C3H family n=1 Tax=Rosa chinensis TaxID=74649 RepID=A0A2P6Q605_ROSCH|nr:30-kDa cleavage and polyadenylation specificity factor 30 [Rosa chinensis]PRQ29615.1 putative transcription factor C3H family [Rosa chinensis]
MEDSDGVLNFDFEGGLDATADAGPIHTGLASNAPIQSDSLVAQSNNQASAAPQPDPNVNPSGQKSFRQTVSRHWLRSLCMKGEACGFLHQYDKSRMPVCRFFRMYGECREQDCVYKHTNEDIKECNM